MERPIQVGPYFEIRGQALTASISDEIIRGKTRVVLKDHWKSERLAEFGFTQHKRKTSLFHYGALEL
ncbi:hypothetical protein [Aquibacillus rhizosphaerae]|uniref:Uncharacterized protein n=1 Tax=Aquibacillus rhizosphaerae TaxID=3051431 RepID=A0ABT7LBK6_9BACI|nr:hypothetical protein [Aquibacillus sp. LR5S19]MDL4843233.1 hypothetical protein [Aquibacillus sp. LR5S19]